MKKLLCVFSLLSFVAIAKEKNAGDRKPAAQGEFLCFGLNDLVNTSFNGQSITRSVAGTCDTQRGVQVVPSNEPDKESKYFVCCFHK